MTDKTNDKNHETAITGGVERQVEARLEEAVTPLKERIFDLEAQLSYTESSLQAIAMALFHFGEQHVDGSKGDAILMGYVQALEDRAEVINRVLLAH